VTDKPRTDSATLCGRVADSGAVRAFVDGLPKAARARLPESAALSPVLTTVLNHAKERWPGTSVPAAAFYAHLARHLKAAKDPLETLAKLKTDDLFIALACARKTPHALELLEAAVRNDVRQALAGQRLDAGAQDEVLQRLRARLFMAEGSKEARIAGYAGHGPLAAWVCAAAVRLALDLRREGKSAEVLDEEVADHMSDDTDIELQYIKGRYRKEFRIAFQEAFQALEPGERNLLRFNFIEGLNVEEIGAMTGAHRSTVARRIARVREVLFEGTRRVLSERFNLSGSELNSLLMLVKSDFDVSLHEALREPRSVRLARKG
jgi:RNA polymerase sigma-70 factor (ECF subfamily)